MTRTRLVWAVLIIGAAAGVSSAGTWVPLASEEPAGELSVKEALTGTQVVELEVELPGLELEAVHTEYGDFTRVEIPGLGGIGEVGQPMLPALRRFVEIPAGAVITADSLVLEEQLVDLGAKGLPATLYPVQLPQPKCDCKEARAWRFSHDPAAYQGLVAPEPLSLGEPVTIRDHRLVMLTLAPVSYEPAKGLIHVASRVRVTLALTGADLKATQARKQRLASRHFDSFLIGNTLNLNFGGKAAGWAYPDSAPVELLIITPPQFVTDLQPFVDWKTSCGYHVSVATTDVTGTTTTTIKNHITGLYGGANPPVYILMIGDSPGTLITYSESPGGGGGTDLPYVQMDGDLYPDMIIARWPIDNSTELIAMRDKILFYEQPTAANSAWLNRALFMEGSGYQGAGVTTHADVIAELMQPFGTECTRWLETANHSVADLIADLTTGGRAWAVYSAHSGPSGWSGPPPLSSGDMPNFTNVDKYPLGFGHSCSSNEFHNYDDVFGETTVIQANKGFVSYWGGSASTYWDGDDWLERGFFDSLFDADMAGNASPMDRQYSQGAACYAGLTQVTLSNQSNEQYYWRCYNLDGDPTLDPFTRQPIAMTVGAPPVVPPVATDDFTVTVSDPGRGLVPGALVGVTQDGALLGAGYTDASGTAVFHIDAPAAGSDLLVRVTAHNHLPTDATTMVAAGSDGVVVLNAGVYRCDATVTIDVFDNDLDGLGTITVNLAATPSGGSTSVTLYEQAGSAVRFQGTAVLGTDLPVANADTLTVTYHDADVGTGLPGDKTDTATLDCAGPVITNLQVSEIGATSAVVSWDTDEPSNSWAQATPGGAVASSTDYVTAHSLLISGLDQCSWYTVRVTSMDLLGNLRGAGPTDPFMTLQETVAFVDDVESGNIGWTAQAPWAISAEASHSPANAWSDSPGGSYANSINVSLTSPVMNLAALSGPELRFFHTYALESGWDYGYLEVTTNGSTWTELAAYNGTASGWTEEVVDLSAYAGSTSFQIRFRLETDGSQTYDGWHIDDVEISAMGECPLFADGFESGDTSAWDATVGAP